MQPVVRALNILRALGDSSGGLGLQELADKLELPVSTVHRLVGVLESEDFVFRTPRDKRLMLGSAVRSLISHSSSAYLRKAGGPAIARLNRETGETVFLAEIVGKEVVCISFAEGTRPLHLTVRLGSTLPLHAASSARVLLASMDDDTVRSILEGYPFTRWTPRTMTEEAALLNHLTLVRDRGYDVCEDEMDNHAWAVAAPVHDSSGEVRAAVALVAPLPTVGDANRRDQLKASIIESAAEISLELGAAAMVDPPAPRRQSQRQRPDSSVPTSGVSVPSGT